MRSWKSPMKAVESIDVYILTCLNILERVPACFHRGKRALRFCQFLGGELPGLHGESGRIVARSCRGVTQRRRCRNEDCISRTPICGAKYIICFACLKCLKQADEFIHIPANLHRVVDDSADLPFGAY